MTRICKCACLLVLVLAWQLSLTPPSAHATSITSFSWQTSTSSNCAAGTHFDWNITVTGNADDGAGWDLYGMRMFDYNGNKLDDWPSYMAGIGSPISLNSFAEIALATPTARPFYIEFYEVGVGGGGIMYSTVFDPGCSNLPTYAPNVTINDVTHTETDSGTTTYTFTVTLSSAYKYPVDVTWTTANNTAVAGSDYVAASGTVHFAANELSKTLDVTTNNDNIFEINETFFVNLTGASNAAMITDSQGVGTITNNDPMPSVTLSASPTTISENGGSSIVTAALSSVAGVDTTINLGFTGTAASGTDYNTTGTAILIPSGNSSGSITINAIDNSVDTVDKTVIVDIVGATNATESGVQQSTITLEDDDETAVTLALTGSPLAENGGTATVTASVPTPIGEVVTVNLGFSGTATSGTDYTASNTVITIPIGGTSGSSTLTGMDDPTDEPDETIIVDITSVTGVIEAFEQQVTASITDDDVPTVTLSLTGSPLAEASGTATVTATLSNTAYQDTTIALGFTGTADASDYSASASITIPVGSDQGSITISGVNDTLDEPDETVIVDITSVTNATESGTQQVTATITDDDLPTFTILADNANVAEDGGTAVVTVTLSSAANEAVTFNLTYLLGTATLNTDYTASAATISIPIGGSTGSITLISQDDSTDEPDETIVVDVASVTGAIEIGTQQATTSITDDDVPTVTLSLTGSPLAEASGAATVTATLSNTAYQDATITLGFTGTADASDYSALSSITIPVGSDHGSVTISGVNDTLDELDETVIVDITSVTNATESGIQQVTATITDDDFPTFMLVADNANIAEDGGTAVVTVTLSSAANEVVTFNLTYLLGTATLNTDYTASAATISIPIGGSTGSITLTSQDDSADEPDETIVVDVASVTGAIETGAQQASTAIVDDDLVSVTLGLTGSPFAEDGGSATVTATLASATFSDVTVNLSFSGTATNGTDYTPSGASIFIPTGSPSGIITLTGISDMIDEIDEAIIIDVNSVSGGGTEATPQQVTATIIDNDTAAIIVTPTSGLTTTEAGGTASFSVVLTSEPLALVTINFTSSDTSEGVVPPSISFDASNWGVGQNVIITGMNDPFDDGNVPYTILTDVVTTDPNYGSPVDDISVTNLDNDTADVTIMPTSGLITTEGGGTASFSVVLTSEPTAPVTINFTSSDTSEGTVPASITFNVGVWNVPQLVTVTGVNDALVDGNIAYTITTSVTSTDSLYAAIDPADVSLSNTDDDTAAIIITPTGAPLTTEAGGTTSFSVVLTSEPAAPVTVNFTSSDTSEGTVPASISFNAGDWSTPKDVIITGVNDDVVDGDIPYTIVTSVTTSDPVYTLIDPLDLSLTNADNDITGITITPTSGLITTEAGGTASFNVVLMSAPTAPVAINFTSTNTAEGNVPASVSFNDLNWSITQDVVITGVDDLVMDGDIAYAITTSVSTADPLYAAMDPADVSVTNQDNDIPGVNVTPNTLLILEGTATSYQLSLNTMPSSGTVDIQITFNPAQITVNGSSVSPVTLTFSDLTPQIISVVSLDNSIDDGPRTTPITHTISATGAAEYPPTMTVSDVNVTIDDDDDTIVVPPQEIPLSPPAPMCNAMDFDEQSVVRAWLPDEYRTDVYCHLIVENGHYLWWYGSPLTNPGEVGVQSVLEQGVLQAVDVFSPSGLTQFEGGGVVCLRGSGELWFLAASQAPRVPQQLTIYSVEEFPGYVCGTLYEPGTLVLIQP